MKTSIIKPCKKCGYDFGIIIHDKGNNRLVVEDMGFVSKEIPKMLLKEEASNMCEGCRMDYNIRILIQMFS